MARAAVLGKSRFDHVALARLSRANCDPAKRLDLMAKLDAVFFLLFGIKRPDVEYILFHLQRHSQREQDNVG